MLNKISYATLYQARDINQWSGTPYFQIQALEAAHLKVDCENLGKIKLSTSEKLNRYLKKWLSGQSKSLRYDISLSKKYADFLSRVYEKNKPDFILSPQVQPLAYLDTQQPIVLWTDALFASLVGFYPPANSLSKDYVNAANDITRACLNRCTLAVFSSDWARFEAIHYYGFAKEKTLVIPFGANLNITHEYADIQAMIKARSKTSLQLLFVGKRWHQKGGDIVLAVAHALHAAKVDVTLHIVGSVPQAYKDKTLPPYVHCHGFIDKNTAAGQEKMRQLFCDSHFFFMPTRADCCAVVYAEASAFGVPSLASFVGGNETIVKENENGMTFALDTPITVYCDYILNLFNNRTQYEALALSSFSAYQTHFNWQVAIKRLLDEIKTRVH